MSVIHHTAPRQAPRRLLLSAGAHGQLAVTAMRPSHCRFGYGRRRGGLSVAPTLRSATMLKKENTALMSSSVTLRGRVLMVSCGDSVATGEQPCKLQV